MGIESAPNGLVQLPESHYDTLVDLAERGRYVEEAKKARSPFKRGGFGMFNRPWLWRSVSRSKLPQRFKVVFYCWTHHGKDGHCTIKGDLGSVVLGQRLTASNAAKLVSLAVGEGLLGEGSNTRCLIAPWGVRYMTTDDVSSQCGLHD
ncbi:hypothetical protein JTZ10_16270 [Gordonia rubripertincta]|uniref:Uncharacterized protein n=1 Tax=Gordonia rubripertincta TaxID=36822 RepID=A0AAW4G6L0_GORRU|nr:hypothetical protein [Gordonia rubripertincta]MBM7279306.1 hypothetical protein [Gordonia rubripertincta]